jgi:hypothetical protein
VGQFTNGVEKVAEMPCKCPQNGDHPFMVLISEFLLRYDKHQEKWKGNGADENCQVPCRGMYWGMCYGMVHSRKDEKTFLK